MSLAAPAAPSSARRAGTRWLLLGSLALNLFFIGVAVAMAIRAPAPHALGSQRVRAHRAAGRDVAAGRRRRCCERRCRPITTPSTTAQDKYHAARDEIRETLRQDPFKVEDMRAAMARRRAARQSFDLVIQGVFADAAAENVARRPPWRSPTGASNRKTKRNRQ